MLKQISTNLFRFAGYQKSSNIRLYSSKCTELVIEPRNQVVWMRMNRPEKFNAINEDMYLQMLATINEVNTDKSIKAVVLTGTGAYYSSGNDLSSFVKSLLNGSEPKTLANHSKKIMIDFVDALINSEKFLIAAVNGPAIGIPVTTLPLFDYVIASDKATFQTPFTAIGQCPEACSSLTFPRVFGHSKANELLALNMTWDAQKALANNLVANVIEHDKFDSHVEDLLYGKRGIISSCYPNSMMVTKSLVRDPNIKRELLATNRREADAIAELWISEECFDALRKFSKRSK